MSRTSYFNKTVFQKNITRFFPVWFLYTVLILLMGPAQAMQENTPFVAARNLLNLYGSYGAVELGYGFLTAFLLFSYLFSARTANMYHSFPVRRETYFFTNVITGLLFDWVPNALAAVICAAFSPAEPVVAALWFLVRSLEYLLGFAVAVLAIHCAGNFIGAGLLTLVLHAGLPAGEYLVRHILTRLLYGMPSADGAWTEKIAPAYWLFDRTLLSIDYSYLDYDALPDSLLSYIVVGWGHIAILAAYCVLCLGLALLLYRRRPMESAGDIVAFPKSGSVFKYVFALGCALVFGSALVDIVFPSLLSSNWIRSPWKILLCLCAAGAVGYFAAEMLLEKSIRVFRPRYLARCAGVVAFLCACVLTVHFDPAKLQEKVPGWTEVASVQLGIGQYSDAAAPEITDEETIREVVALHQIFVDNREEIQDRLDGVSAVLVENGEATGMAVDTEAVAYHGDDISNVTICYQLKDGSALTRRYRLRTSVYLPDIENLGQRLDAILNRQDYMEARFFAYSDLQTGDDPWAALRESVASGWVQFYEANGVIMADAANLSDLEAQGLVDALQADLKDKALPEVVTDAFAPGSWQESPILGQIVLNVNQQNPEKEVLISSVFYIDFSAESENILAYLESLGIAPGETEAGDNWGSTAQ